MKTLRTLERRVRLLAGLLAAFGVVLAIVYIAYRNDIDAARARVDAGSQIAQTACGPIEYAERGRGPAVLLVHGAGGGWDQGLEMGERLAAGGHRVVMPSRFGYLKTPAPADTSPASQADAHGCLLDALGIDRAAVIGISAGAPSSMQFAIRHGTRTSGLALLVPLAFRPGPPQKPPAPWARFIFERVLRSDVLFWLAIRSVPDAMVKTILGTPPAVLRHVDAAERDRAMAVLGNILPVSARQRGILEDSAIAQALPRYDLESVAAPTLVVSLRDDLYGTYEGSRYTAAHIPVARLVEYPSGGHAWAGHHAEVMAELETFLQPLE